MRKEFVMRGQTASGSTEILNFSGFKPGMAYKLIDFDVYPAANIGTTNFEGTASITAGKLNVSPNSPDFNDDGLIGTTYFGVNTATGNAHKQSILNDTFLITQNLILEVRETDSGAAVNWQCKFERVKMTGPEEAVTNYKQFAISDE